jgi:hypothetical protein
MIQIFVGLTNIWDNDILIHQTQAKRNFINMQNMAIESTKEQKRKITILKIKSIILTVILLAISFYMLILLLN